MAAGKFFLGIEGGATRTTGVVTDARLSVVARHVAGPSNIYAVGEDRALAAAGAIVGALRRETGPAWTQVAASALGMAGLRRPADRDVWQRIARALGVPEPMRLTHDADAALAAGSHDATGILVVSGTGSLVYGRTAQGREHRVGGRGPLLGDGASGFDIGRRALRAAARAEDAAGEPTRLAPLILARLGLNDFDDLVAWANPFAKDRVAALAPAVFEAAAEGDPVAGRIIEDAVAELARGVAIVADTLWPTRARREALPVILSGGVLRGQKTFRDALAAAVAERVAGARCTLAEAEGAVGAARLAQRSLREPGG